MGSGAPGSPGRVAVGLTMISAAVLALAVLSACPQGDDEESGRRVSEILRGCSSVVSLARSGAGELLTHWDLRKTRGAWDAARTKLQEALPGILPGLRQQFPRETERLTQSEAALDRTMGELFLAAERKIQATAARDEDGARAAMEEVLEAWQEANRKAVEVESTLLRLGEEVTDQLSREAHRREESGRRLLWVTLAGGAVLGLFLLLILSFMLQIRKTAAALREKERLLSEAQQMGHFGSWEWEIDKGRVTWSDELFRMYGLEPGRFTPTYEAFLERVHADDRAAVAATIQESLRTRAPFSFEYRITGPRGEPRVIFARGEIVDDGKGRPLRMVGMAHDITDQKKVEILKNELVSTISHELRTPLTSIRGSLGLVAGGVLGQLPAQAKGMVDIAHQNSQRLVLLVNDILDIEKLASGKMEFDLKPHPVLPLLEQGVEANRGYAQPLGVLLEITDAAPDAIVRVDADRFLQVLANLISNACKFSPRGAVVGVGVARAGGFIRVAVTDRGPGIPDAFRPKMFQKFSQADGADNRSNKGTGLGLAICKGMVEQMRGTIGFETEVGRGTTFYFEFREAVDPRPASVSVPSGSAGPDR